MPRGANLGSDLVNYATKLYQQDVDNSMRAFGLNQQAQQQAFGQAQAQQNMAMRAQEMAAQNQQRGFGQMADLYKFNSQMGYGAYRDQQKDQLARDMMAERQEGYDRMNASKEAMAGDRLWQQQQRMEQDAAIAQKKLDHNATQFILRNGGAAKSQLTALRNQQTTLRSQARNMTPEMYQQALSAMQGEERALLDAAQEQMAGEEDEQTQMKKAVANRITTLDNDTAWVMDQHGVPKQHFRYEMEDPKHRGDTRKTLMQAFTKKRTIKSGSGENASTEVVEEVDMDGLNQEMRYLEDDQREAVGLPTKHGGRPRKTKTPTTTRNVLGVGIPVPGQTQMEEPGPRPRVVATPGGRPIEGITDEARALMEPGKVQAPKWADTPQKQAAHKTIASLKQKLESGAASPGEREMYVNALRALGIIQ